MEKKKFSWKQCIPIAFFILIGAACGVILGESLSEFRLLYVLILLAVMYGSIFVHLIIHEGGHLVFGLLTGYRFSSFRILGFMWVKEGGKLKFRQLSIAGTSGQCLMTPPDLVDGKMPVVLYNLGGSLMNVIVSAVFLGLHFAAPLGILRASLLIFALIGVGLAAMNGIPMRMGVVDNDGYNALSLRRNPKAIRAFWIQMKANEQIAAGIRLKDMPEEWFAVPSDEEMQNSMIAPLGVFAHSRLIDAHRFADADALAAHLLSIDSGIVGLHRSLVICERIYCELITQNRREVLDGFLSPEQRKFMKSMKTYPSVLRTEYAYALLGERDTAKAESVMAQFEKCAKRYPYPTDVAAERELMEIAAQKA